MFKLVKRTELEKLGGYRSTAFTFESIKIDKNEWFGCYSVLQDSFEDSHTC